MRNANNKKGEIQRNAVRVVKAIRKKVWKEMIIYILQNGT